MKMIDWLTNHWSFKNGDENSVIVTEDDEENSVIVTEDDKETTKWVSINIQNYHNHSTFGNIPFVRLCSFMDTLHRAARMVCRKVPISSHRILKHREHQSIGLCFHTSSCEIPLIVMMRKISDLQTTGGFFEWHAKQRESRRSKQNKRLSHNE